MKPIAPLFLTTFLLSCSPSNDRQAPAAQDSVRADSETVSVTGPTLFAMAPWSSAYLDSAVTTGSDLAVLLDDFSHYLGVTDSALAARGVRVVLRVDTILRWRAAGRDQVFRPDPDSGVAYLLWTPSGIHIRHGVRTDVDLLALVDSALAIPRRAAPGP